MASQWSAVGFSVARNPPAVVKCTVRPWIYQLRHIFLDVAEFLLTYDGAGTRGAFPRRGRCFELTTTKINGDCASRLNLP